MTCVMQPHSTAASTAGCTPPQPILIWGLSPPDPLHALSLGASPPRSVRGARCAALARVVRPPGTALRGARARRTRRGSRPQTPYTLSRSALRRLAPFAGLAALRSLASYVHQVPRFAALARVVLDAALAPRPLH